MGLGVEDRRKYREKNVHTGVFCLKVPAKAARKSHGPRVCDLLVIPLGSPASENLYPQNEGEVELGKFLNRGQVGD